MKILVVEDDPETAGYLARGLRQDQHVVDVASTAEDGLELAGLWRFDLVVLDRMLPGMDGLAFVKALRSRKNAARVLFLTAMGGIDDRVQGLEAGGDDYLTKPFAYAELRARVAALGRRQLDSGAPNTLTAGDLSLDLLRRSAIRAGLPIELLAKEFQLLEYFLRNQGRVVTRTMLLEQVWQIDFDPGSNVVETHISRLRAKIDKPFATPLLKTLRGIGYRLDADT
jgi:two-component system, OmpR family, response regulator